MKINDWKGLTLLMSPYKSPMLRVDLLTIEDEKMMMLEYLMNMVLMSLTHYFIIFISY